ncbi:hypothetical protein GSO30_002215 [Salmonella enterica]|nr:hypothetical protein [Salmonella enterica]EGB7057963.1 BglI family type II restriction endonuclease [Salmonella enterica]
MFNQQRYTQFSLYNEFRKILINDPNILINLENFFICKIRELIYKSKNIIEKEYNEASFLYPFWQNYPPDNRGRQPRGDQFPWIEVGEHTIGRKLTRNLSYDFELYDIGVPTGADERFLLKSQEIRNITHGIFDSAFLSIDIKSVGPRDDFFHAVMSHNQISGDGQWNIPEAGMVNTPLKAQGLYASHDFHCSLPPLYVLSDNTVAPVITMAIKPVYDMLSLHTELNRHGQPLKRITLISIPNGLLLTQNPNYLSKYPSLLYPGKDDKGKNPLKVRARVDFSILQNINDWRVEDIFFTSDL